MSKNITVLLIEDESQLADLYELHLKKEYEVVIAENYESFKKVFSGDPVHLIIMDLEIPGTSGMELLRELNQDQNWKDVPVVALSNMSNPEIEQFTLGLGAKEFLRKTEIEPKDLIELVGKYV